MHPIEKRTIQYPRHFHRNYLLNKDTAIRYKTKKWGIIQWWWEMRKFTRNIRRVAQRCRQFRFQITLYDHHILTLADRGKRHTFSWKYALRKPRQDCMNLKLWTNKHWEYHYQSGDWKRHMIFRHSRYPQSDHQFAKTLILWLIIIRNIDNISRTQLGNCKRPLSWIWSAK